MHNYKNMMAIVLASSLVLSACGGDSDSDDANPAPAEELTILVTDDDGIRAPGIDALVIELNQLDNVDVIVVAPAENQSGSSDMMTDGPVTWQADTTLSGYAGQGVNGYPADSVRVALEELDIEPDLVVSGVNQGQNVGPFAALSGTVGAARYAARSGIPAVASSAGIGANADYAAGARLVTEWIEDNRTALENGSARTDVVISFNVPGCTAGAIRDLVSVPMTNAIPDGINVFETDCSVEPDSAPINDVDAMIKGHAAVSEVPLEL